MRPLRKTATALPWHLPLLFSPSQNSAFESLADVNLAEMAVLAVGQDVGPPSATLTKYYTGRHMETSLLPKREET